MVKTHEINLNTSEFNRFAKSNYIILNINNAELNDYILFKQVENAEEGEVETGLFSMTQIKELITGTGLADGYALIVVSKLS